MRGMLSDPLRKQLWRLTIPIFVEIALVMLVGAVDVFMLSSCGDGVVGAVGLDNQLMSLVFLVYQFASVGLGIVCAQYHGAGLRTRLVQVVGIALAVNAVLGAAVSAFVCCRAEELLRLMGLEEALVPDGAVYLRITSAFSFFQALSFTFSASLRSVDKVKYPMYITVLVNVLNVVGNYLLIFGHCGFPKMGVAGAAWATVFSRGVSAVLMGVVHTRVHIPRFPRAWFTPFPWRECRNLFRVGFPAMGEELSYCLSQVVITFFITRIGTDALVTRTYAMNLIMFVFLFCCSITQGGDILVGHLVGRRLYRPAYLIGNFFMRRSMLVTLVCSAALAAAGPWIFAVLSDSETVRRLGVTILAIDVFLEVGRVRNIFACGTLRAAADPIYPLVVGMCSQWIVAVGFAWILAVPLHWGLVGAWVAFALDENLRGVILMRRWHTKGWVGRSLA